MINELVNKGILLSETIAVLCCIHGLFPKRKIADMQSAVFVLGNLIFLDIVNTYHLGRVWTYWLYLFWALFLFWKFKCSVRYAMWGMVICVVVVTVLQFCFAVLLVVCGVKNPLWVYFGGNAFTIVFLLWIRHKKWLANLLLINKGVFGWVMLGGIALLAIADLLVYSKSNEGVQMELFLGAIPITGFLILMMGGFLGKNRENEKIKEELRERHNLQYLYRDLLQHVRIKQHNFNNQITAILGSHYVCKTYEELVKTQGELCQEIQEDNKFYKLLGLQDSILAGYLYRKFKEMEAGGTTVHYEISAKTFQVAVPIQILMEMLGILFDNAAEAVKEKEGADRTVYVVISEEEHCNIVEISNACPRVSYEEIESWFAFGRSSKGKGRGIGLARVKELCEEYPCDVGVAYREVAGSNRIVFSLFLNKGI